MKKFLVIALVVIFLSGNAVSAQKTEKVFLKLTQKMLVSAPVETIKHKNVVVSYWMIDNGGFFYSTEKQEFQGKYKNYNFTSTSNETIVLGVSKKEKKKVKKELLQAIIASQFY